MISGDFNSIPGSATHIAMINAGFVDSRNSSIEKKSIDKYTDTTSDWYGSTNTLIDYVWMYVGDAKRYDYSVAAVQSVRHIPVPCCLSRAGNNTYSEIDSDKSYPTLTEVSSHHTASDHLLIVVDFNSN